MGCSLVGSGSGTVPQEGSQAGTMAAVPPVTAHGSTSSSVSLNQADVLRGRRRGGGTSTH